MNAKVCLKDTQGNVLQTQLLNAGKSTDFNVENLKVGVYLVELQLPHGKAITHQFYINN